MKKAKTTLANLSGLSALRLARESAGEPTTEPRTVKKRSQDKSRLKASTPLAAPAPAQQTEGKRRGRPRAKHSDPNYYQVTLYIKRKVHREVKRELLDEEPPLEFSDVANDMLEEWLRRRGVDTDQFKLT